MNQTKNYFMNCQEERGKTILALGETPPNNENNGFAWRKGAG